MARVRPPSLVWPFVGVLAADGAALAAARGRVEGEWGGIVAEAGPFDFSNTDYYADEMGRSIRRVFWASQGPVDPGGLPEAKLRANALEDELAEVLRTTPPPSPASASPSGSTEANDGTKTGKEGEAAAEGWARPVNIDPGYVALDKVVLASAKNFAHRLYIGDGIYAEVTLSYRRARRAGGRGKARGAGVWTPLPWTFPDYADGRYFPFFDALRQRLTP